MPFEYLWKPLATCTDVVEVEDFLDSQKSHLVQKSQFECCTVCVPNVDRHLMRYILMRCNSSKCKEYCAISSCSPCPWFLLLRARQHSGVTQIFQHSTHVTPAASPTNGKLNLQMKRFVREKTEKRLKPSQILNDLIDAFNLTDVEGLLPKVQSLSTSHRRNHLGNNNFIDEMVDLANCHRFSPEIDDLIAFLFGFDVDATGSPILGDGSPTNPLLIGTTTKKMIRRLSWAAEYPLHVDATFKLNSFRYPVIVVGVSDYARQFHPIAFFLTSDLKTKQYQRALQATLNMYEKTAGEVARIRMIMADADQAERNACETISVDGDQPSFKMCWFHVMKSVKWHSRQLSAVHKRLVYKHVYRMHYSRDFGDFEARKQAALDAWGAVPECAKIAKHIVDQWLTGRFTEWQCYTSPPGFAKTNNPLEAFNADIKREYTKHDVVTLNCLLQLLMRCAKHRSVRAPSFATLPRPSDEMIRRYNRVAAADAFTITQLHRGSVQFLLDGNTNVYQVFQRAVAPSVPSNDTRASNKQIEDEASATIETNDQPSTGWVVDVGAGSCTCRTWISFGYCVHVIACRVLLQLPVEGLVFKRATFVNKRQKQISGRPKKVGGALSYE